MTNQQMANNRENSRSRTRTIAFCGVSIALLTLGAWVTIPIGPTPVTLQVLVAAFVLCALRPREAVCVMAGYLLLGAVGLPIFSGMRGGIGVLAGPTGGYLWGMAIGMIVAVVVRSALHRMSKGAAEDSQQGAFSVRSFAIDLLAALVFLAITYLLGFLQIMQVAALTPFEAFAVSIAPFIVIDLIKIVVAIGIANAVKQALSHLVLA